MYLVSCRDFISPHILKMEYGLANEMEQYETKYKARQLLGVVDDNATKTSKTTKQQRSTSYFSKIVGGF